MRRLAVWAVLAFTAGDAWAGGVSGTVRFAGPPPPTAPIPVSKDKAVCGTSVPDESFVAKDGRLAHVVVVLKGAPALPPATAVLDQRGCRFTPHVQAVPLGSTLDIQNGDPLLHNIHGWLGRMTRFNVPMPTQGMHAPAKLDRPGVVAVRCDVHGWMSAWIVVVEGPAAVSGEDGAFSIRGVPAGSYTATAWHERLGERTAQVTVPAEGEVALDFTFGG